MHVFFDIKLRYYSVRSFFGCALGNAESIHPTQKQYRQEFVKTNLGRHVWRRDRRDTARGCF